MPGEFGAAAQQLARFLLWECGRWLETRSIEVECFDGSDVGVRVIDNPPAGVSILRAGEAFSGVFREIFPQAPLFHLGIRRNERTLEHEVYLDRVREDIASQRVMVLDPMLATGGSAVVALNRVRQVFRGPVDVVTMVSAPLGVDAVLEADPDVRIVTAALDSHLNDQGYIVPGLGDAGDRFFGTAEAR
jgi:uracil phosphoribosyltransferase